LAVSTKWRLSMTSYVGKHAGFYDFFYADKCYKSEAAFIHQCLQEFGKHTPNKILELACGTGSHVFEFEKFGYQIIATDYSEDMLKCAKHKGKLSSSSVIFQIQDMRDLNVLERPFDAVICLFDSIGYVVTNDALKKVLQNVHNHLAEDGLFIFEFWHAAAMLKLYDPVRIRKWKTSDSEIIRLSETTIDISRQVGSVKYTILDLKKNGEYYKIEETQENRFFLVQEMDMYLKQNNFEPLQYFAGFNNGEQITTETWHIVAVARRK